MELYYLLVVQILNVYVPLMKYLWMILSNIVQSFFSNYIRSMVIRMEITSHLLPGKSEETCYSSLKKLCSDLGFSLTPKVIHTDFEESIMKVIRNFFPSILIKSCRFHLAQNLQRKIQNLGFACHYKDENSEIGK